MAINCFKWLYLIISPKKIIQLCHVLHLSPSLVKTDQIENLEISADLVRLTAASDCNPLKQQHLFLILFFTAHHFQNIHFLNYKDNTFYQPQSTYHRHKSWVNMLLQWKELILHQALLLFEVAHLLLCLSKKLSTICREGATQHFFDQQVLTFALGHFKVAQLEAFQIMLREKAVRSPQYWSKVTQITSSNDCWLFFHWQVMWDGKKMQARELTNCPIIQIIPDQV